MKNGEGVYIVVIAAPDRNSGRNTNNIAVWREVRAKPIMANGVAQTNPNERAHYDMRREHRAR